MIAATDAGLGAAIEDLLDQALTIRLFGNDLEPADSTVLSDVHEMVAAGYQAVTLGRQDWTVMLPPAPDEPTAIAAPILWTFETTAGPVFGYFVTDAKGRLRWLERFEDGPYQVTGKGFKLTVTPRFTLNEGP